MRIGIDCRLWSQSGVGRYIRNLVVNLAELDTQNDYVLFVKGEDVNQVKIEVRSQKFEVVKANIAWHSVAEQISFPKILAKEKLDLVHFTYFSVPIFYRGKFVMTMHDIIPFSYATGKASTLPLPLYYVKFFAYQFVVKKALHKAQKIIVPSHAVKKDILKRANVNSQKIVVTYEGVSSLSNGKVTNVIERNNLKAKKFFLYVGNAYPHKNLKKLLEGFLQFSSNNPEFRVVFAGKKDYFYDRLISSPQATALGDSFLFLNSPTDSELSLLYKNALAFVSPSLMEGFALTALDALSSGAPVLLSDIPVFREIVKNIPIVYFNPNNEADIRNAFEYSTKQPRKSLDDRIQLGKMLAKTYSWKRMAEQTLRVYESCTSI